MRYLIGHRETLTHRSRSSIISITLLVIITKKNNMQNTFICFIYDAELYNQNYKARDLLYSANASVRTILVDLNLGHV